MQQNNQMQNHQASNFDTSSRFEGRAAGYWGRLILAAFLSTITFGLTYWWANCMMLRWKYRNTFINGKRLEFRGRAISLFGKYIVWVLLGIITLGIHTVFFLPVRYKQWVISNVFVDGDNIQGSFEPGIGHYFGQRLLRWFITVITFGIGYWYAAMKFERFVWSETVISNRRLESTVTGMGYLGKSIVWFLLTIVTIGIYGIWVPIKRKRFFIENVRLQGT